MTVSVYPAIQHYGGERQFMAFSLTKVMALPVNFSEIRFNWMSSALFLMLSRLRDTDKSV